MDEKCKPCEICMRIGDVFSEACFNPKMFTNGLKMVLWLWGWIESMEWKHTYFLVKEKDPDVLVSKESNADSLLGQERNQ